MIVWAIVALWLVRTGYAMLFHAYLWQLKEYRTDRVRAHLSTRKGRRPVLAPLNWLKWLLFLVLLVPAARTWPVAAFLVVALILYLVEVASQGAEALRRRMRRPVFTRKSKTVVGVAGAIEGVGLLVAILLSGGATHPLRLLGALLLLDRMLFAVVAAAALLPLTASEHTQTINAAYAKMRQFPALPVVGITGSFGKTSAKEFVATILGARYRVVKTLGNTNTVIGVARAVRDLLEPGTEIFVVEMGAYRRGEIKRICDLVPPTVAVLTAVEDQHLALFGSLEETLRAKMELSESLPADGVTVLNLDSAAIAAHLDDVHGPRRTYAMTRAADLIVRDIVVAPESLTFAVVTAEDQSEFAVNLVGRQNIPSILAATAVAGTFGMTLAEIVAAARAISPIKRTMEPVHHPSGALLVDDTYSASSGSTRAALDYLSDLQDVTRILVFSEIIELGEAATPVHAEIGARMAAVCDLAVVTSTNYAEMIATGWRSAPHEGRELVIEENVAVAARLIAARLTPRTVVVFEGRGPERILRHLLSGAEGD